MKVVARPHANVEKFHHQAENELEELQEQIGIHIYVSPPLLSLSLLWLSWSHILSQMPSGSPPRTSNQPNLALKWK